MRRPPFPSRAGTMRAPRTPLGSVAGRFAAHAVSDSRPEAPAGPAPLSALIAGAFTFLVAALVFESGLVQLGDPLTAAAAAFVLLGAAYVGYRPMLRWALGGVALAVAVHAGSGFVEVARANLVTPPGFDVSVFWIEAKVAASGGNFYDPALAREIGNQIGLGQDVLTELAFWYPPPTMLLFLPLGWMDIHAATATIYIVSGIALLADGYLLWRMFLSRGGVPALAASYALLLLPAQAGATISFGQSNYVLLLGLLLMWRARRQAAGGAWFVLANIVKPALLLLAPFLLIRSGRRAILGAMVTGCIVLLATVAVFGLDTTLGYLTANPMTSAPAFLYSQDVNQSLLAVIVRATGDMFAFGPGAANALYLVASAAIIGAVVYLTIRTRVDDDLAFGLAVAASLLVYPGTLYHYALVLLPVALVPWAKNQRILAGFGSEGRRQLASAAFAAFVVFLLATDHGLATFAAAGFMFAALSALAFVATLRQPMQQAASADPGDARALAATEPDAGMRICTTCGDRVASGMSYCRSCGRRVGPILPSSDRPLFRGLSAARGLPVSVAATTAPMPTQLNHDPFSAADGRGPDATDTPQAMKRYRRGHRSRYEPVDAAVSANITLTRGQVMVVRFIAATLFLGVVINAVATAITVIAVVTAMYVGAIVFRLRIFLRAMSNPSEIRITDEEARGLWAYSLPIYTILVPAYREPQVIGQLIRSLDALEYPKERLDIKLLLEEDDHETIAAAEAAKPGDHFEIVRVPYSEPRTKPKACNYGLQRAHGRYVTIYDVEDRPEPLQLRRAIAAFRRLDDRYACLQAKLVYHNPDQNSITRWFSTEYAMWFSQLLPGLIEESAPLPLGGTSNHFSRQVLDEIGGWDPYNVTEDADLGIRLHRHGYRTAVLDSITEEEANSDFVNWIKQRSRWYKGYLQTWLTHMRHPRELYRELGPGGFIGFNLFVGGTPLLSLLNPVFWAITLVWFLGRLPGIEDLFPWWLYYVGMGCMVGGNLLFVYANMVAARQQGKPELVIAAVLSPIYWLMMSVAAIKAVVQLATAPSFWEKTAHGLDQKGAEHRGASSASA